MQSKEIDTCLYIRFFNELACLIKLTTSVSSYTVIFIGLFRLSPKRPSPIDFKSFRSLPRSIYLTTHFIYVLLFSFPTSVDRTWSCSGTTKIIMLRLRLFLSLLISWTISSNTIEFVQVPNCLLSSLRLLTSCSLSIKALRSFIWFPIVQQLVQRLFCNYNYLSLCNVWRVGYPDCTYTSLGPLCILLKW